ncbi:MAG TPA: hypothetical protein VH393_06960 [Ktedonobacterales bacterium]
MTSRKRQTTPEEREERSGAVVTRKRRASGSATPEQTSSPRMVSVTILPTKGGISQNTSTKRTPGDVAHVSSPRHHDARLSVRQCFGELRTALNEGWEIVQPIFARPLWSAADNSTTAFNFVLRREQATRLVTVPEGRTVQRFIRDHELTVDYRR